MTSASPPAFPSRLTQGLCPMSSLSALPYLAARVDVLWRHKFIYTRTAEPHILEELASRCHFVVTAIGD